MGHWRPIKTELEAIVETVAPVEVEAALEKEHTGETGRSFHNDHIIELVSVVIVPDNVDISKPDFNSLCHTSCRIVQKDLYIHVLVIPFDWQS